MTDLARQKVKPCDIAVSISYEAQRKHYAHYIDVLKIGNKTDDRNLICLEFNLLRQLEYSVGTFRIGEYISALFV